MTDTIHINRDGKLTLKTGGIINEGELFKLDDIIMTNRNIKFTEALLLELRKYINSNHKNLSRLKENYKFLYDSYNTQLRPYNDRMNRLKQRYINKLKQRDDTHILRINSEPVQVLDPDLTSVPKQSLDIIEESTTREPDLYLTSSEYAHKMFYIDDI